MMGIILLPILTFAEAHVNSVCHIDCVTENSMPSSYDTSSEFCYTSCTDIVLYKQCCLNKHLLLCK